MRRLWKAAKETAVVLCAALCAFFGYLLTRSPVFGAGEGYEVYLSASSSVGAVCPDDVLLYKLTNATAGESVRYEGDLYGELKERFRAVLLFTEEACGVVSYYLYSPLLSACAEVNGYRVNLHIAVSGEQTAVGTPLIFGGF